MGEAFFRTDAGVGDEQHHRATQAPEQHQPAQHDPEVREGIRAIDAQLDGLWDEIRLVRARLLFGDREKIVARARVEERLERAA